MKNYYIIVFVTRLWLNIFPLYLIFRYSFRSHIASYQYPPARIKYDSCGLGAVDGEKSGFSDPVSVGYTIYDYTQPKVVRMYPLNFISMGQ